jgi:hypothetical protein
LGLDPQFFFFSNFFFSNYLIFSFWEKSRRKKKPKKMSFAPIEKRRKLRERDTSQGGNSFLPPATPDRLTPALLRSPRTTHRFGGNGLSLVCEGKKRSEKKKKKKKKKKKGSAMNSLLSFVFFFSFLFFRSLTPRSATCRPRRRPPTMWCAIRAP